MRLALAVLMVSVTLVGCAGRSVRTGPPGVPVDSRPTPPAPPPETTPPAPPPASTPPNAAPAVEPPQEPPPPVESVMSPDERRQALTRIVADTTTAGAAVRRCAGRKLLPDQESVYDTARSFLDQARGALERDELWRAESLARKARQLAASLNCPG